MTTKSLLAALTITLLTARPSAAQSQHDTPRFTSITAGSAHFCALDTDGDVYCWGDGRWGQLGNGSTESSALVPIRMPSQQRFRQVVAGATHTCALTAGGDPYCWGADQYGAMGDATTRDTCGGLPCATRPMPVALGFRFDSLAAGFEHTCGLADGRLHCWGRTAEGQLTARATMTVCDGVPCSRSARPVAPTMQFSAVSARGDHTCGLSSGRVYCWGGNEFGQLDGTASTRPSVDPIVASPAKFTHVATAAFYTCGITTIGAIECWGANDQAQLGSENLRATRGTIAAPNGDRFAQLSVGGMHSCALTYSGDVYCWGSAAMNRLGGAPTGTCAGTVCSATPVRVALPVKLTALAVGGSMSCAVGANGSIYCWGGAATQGTIVATSGNRRDR